MKINIIIISVFTGAVNGLENGKSACFASSGQKNRTTAFQKSVFRALSGRGMRIQKRAPKQFLSNGREYTRISLSKKPHRDFFEGNIVGRESLFFLLPSFVQRRIPLIAMSGQRLCL